MDVCWRSECQTKAGCTHRGPLGEMCYFPPNVEIDRLRAELAELAEAQLERDTALTDGHDTIQDLRAKLAEWKERHPYGDLDLDMAIEAETKDLKLRIDTLESAQIDYEAQCAAKDARIKEEFDKYCRNLTELAQVHKESCAAKDARIAELEDKLSTAVWSRDHERADNEILHKRIAELEAERALHIEAYNAILARAERAEARVAALIVSNQELCADNIAKDARIVELEARAHSSAVAWEKAATELAVALPRALRAEARAERAEAKLAAVDQQREDFFWDKQRAEAERDALLYNAESQYCAGMSAGFELGRNDDRAELSRIITQRWKEIADAKAHAALAPSPAGTEE